MAIFRKTPPPPAPPGAPGSAIPGAKGPHRPKGDISGTSGRSAPEPLSIILPAVAALGTISSIAAVAWLAEERTADRPKVRRRIDAVLKDLETSCLGIAEILRRVIRASPMFGLLGATSNTAMKFGLLGTRVDPQQSQTYMHLINDIATMLVLAAQASAETTNAIEDGELDPPEDLIYKFGAAQERLSGLLANRASLKTTVETALSTAEALVGAVRELKMHRVGDGKS